jgi:hypothetical protein
MKKNTTFISMASVLVCLAALSLSSTQPGAQGQIRRLTRSGNDKAYYPSLSDDGHRMLYILEKKNGEEITKSIRIRDIESGKDSELFRDKQLKALDPFQDNSLLVGSKPPVLSGDGKMAIFSVSLDQPANILDHYLAIIKTDGTDARIIPFPIEALQGMDIKSLEFKSNEWDRVTNYALSRDGSRIACAVKGHSGPSRYGNASAVILLDTLSLHQETILGPDFNGEQWGWASPPLRPLLGGGWAFGMNGPGNKVLFGAQSTEDKTSYDLYVYDRETKKERKITDFQDRWFSLAEISQDGDKVIFYYTGKKEQGIGTYVVHTDGSGLKQLKSQIVSSIEFAGLSGNGRYVLYKNIYNGMVFDLETDQEWEIFDEDTQGYVQGIVPMDFPRYPAFWPPRFVSQDGSKILLEGPPLGKDTPEIYMLDLDMENKR